MNPAERRGTLAAPAGAVEPVVVVLAVGDGTNADRLGRELERAGCTVDAATGLDGIAVELERGGVDAVLVDLGLGGSDRVLELVADRSTRVAVVAVHPDGEEELALSALRRGVQDCLPWGEATGPRLVRALRHAVERQRAWEGLRSRSLEDSLTGLANRAVLADRITRVLARLRRGRGPEFAVLFLDLDHFKPVNDTFGHAAGDHLLAAVGQRLRASTRPADTVARLGGDEFAILLLDAADVAAAIHAAERLLAVMAEPFVVDGHELCTSVSIGIAVSSTGYERAEDVVRDADVAMYRAKAHGRNCCRVFDPQMHLSAVALLRMETELQDGLAHHAFAMSYQPIVALDSGQVVAFEALVRWDHPQHGLLPVASFLPAAEESGLIVPIGWWALEEACRQTRAWQLRFGAAPALRVNVNVSPRLLMQADMVAHLAGVLERTALPPASLCLEVTERMLLDHGEALAARLAEVQAVGVRLGLDDFGTGYSSLAQLQRLRFDAVKIDGSFVREVAELDEARRLIATILALATLLGVGVVAEGVETTEQALALRQLSCPHAQGFWFARPVDSATAEALLASPPTFWPE